MECTTALWAVYGHFYIIEDMLHLKKRWTINRSGWLLELLTELIIFSKFIIWLMEHSQDAQTFPHLIRSPYSSISTENTLFPPQLFQLSGKEANGVIGSVINLIKTVTHQFVSLKGIRKKGIGVDI